MQTKESMLKKFFSLSKIKHMFGKYVVKHSDEVFKLDVVLNNASDYYDSDSVKLLIDGVYLKMDIFNKIQGCRFWLMVRDGI